MKTIFLALTLFVFTNILNAQNYFTINGDTLKKGDKCNIITANETYSGKFVGMDSLNIFVDNGAIRKISKIKVFRKENQTPETSDDIYIINGDTLKKGVNYDIKTNNGNFTGPYYASDDDNIYLESDKNLIKIQKTSIIRKENPPVSINDKSGKKFLSFSVGSCLLTSDFQSLMDDFKTPFSLSAGYLDIQKDYFAIKFSLDWIFWTRDNKDYSYKYDNYVYNTSHSGGHMMFFTLGHHLYLGSLKPEDKFNFYVIVGIGLNLAVNTTRTSTTEMISSSGTTINSYDSKGSSFFFIGVNCGLGINFRVNEKFGIFFEARADDIAVLSTSGGGYLGVGFIPIKAGLNIRL